MDWLAAVAEGIKAREELDQGLWSLGDLALEIESTYGEDNLPVFADAVGVRFVMLTTYRWVASVYPKEHRVAGLSWFHHRTVAAEPDRLEILTTAAVEHTPVDSLPLMVKLKRVRQRLEEASRILNHLKEESDR